MRMHLGILRSAAWLVPSEQRPEWLAEWNAELWYVRRSGERQTTAFCLGAFRDALWLRRNSPPNAQPWLRLQSPAQCLGFLGLVATACVLLAIHFHFLDGPLLIGQLFLAMLLMPVLSLPSLVATTSLRLGEYPANRCGWRWVFFAGKIAFMLPIVLFGGLDLVPIIGGGAAICWMVLSVLAFRWVLIDQRQRCPQCLRLLDYPTPIGRPSLRFLEWYGTEFVCVKGHGLLHVPETPTTSFRTQRWQHLDGSWSVWFS